MREGVFEKDIPKIVPSARPLAAADKHIHDAREISQCRPAYNVGLPTWGCLKAKTKTDPDATGSVVLHC